MDPRESIEHEQLQSRIRQLEARDALSKAALDHWKGETVNARQDANEWAGHAKDAKRELAWAALIIIALASLVVAALAMRVG